MKVAYLTPGDDAIGPNIFTYNLVCGMIKHEGFECEIFHFNRNERYTNKLTYPVKCTMLRFEDNYDFSEFDIIHSTQIYADSYVVSHGLIESKKCVTSMHCFMYPDFYDRKGKILGWIDVQIWKLSLNQIEDIIVSSTAQLLYYQKHLSKDHRYTIIPYGIPEMQRQPMNEDVEKQIREFGKGRNLICGCGSLIQRKGFHQLISYLTHNKNVGLVLIGEGVEKDNLENQAKELGVSDRVLFMGFLPNSYNYYSLFDVYCMTSSSEGFGLALLEAMCVETPVVCSGLDIYEDFFNEKNVGKFEYGNQNSLNDAIDMVLANKDYYATEARKLYKNTFSVDSMVQRTLDFYQSLRSNKTRRKTITPPSVLILKAFLRAYSLLALLKK